MQQVSNKLLSMCLPQLQQLLLKLGLHAQLDSKSQTNKLLAAVMAREGYEYLLTFF